MSWTWFTLKQAIHISPKMELLKHGKFGLREGKSIKHALRKLLEVIEDAKKREHYVVVISLDIQGAFENLKYDIIRKELRNLFTKCNISETLEDILSNRKVAIRTGGRPAACEQMQGCPQGSCTSPLFWNIVANEILKTDWPKEIHSFTDIHRRFRLCHQWENSPGTGTAHKFRPRNF
ncbi:hypothetical protein AVEN_231626-1 [Araneus ventricosus]|uniref:Reverse transcriptase domain-containing protein n=1 Tax=Araneus ventricosus TaxID=182803 RepID=A0A4Y2QT08_ARAVE|nr:hypothetical protein AVEN_231626-1 [Araneus ventricosus]